MTGAGGIRVIQGYRTRDTHRIKGDKYQEKEKNQVSSSFVSEDTRK